MLRHTTLCAFVVFIMVMGAAYAQGRRSGDCTNLWGSPAWGLCNAYCEAKNCDDSANRNGSENSCTQIYENFMAVAGEDAKMPCGDDSAQVAPPSTASCPCDFDVESWVPNKNQILKTSNLPLCTGSLTNCITCDIKKSVFRSFTSLSVLVTLFDGSFPEPPEPKDSLLFFITEPFDPPAGEACGVDVSFNSPKETPIETKDPVSIAQFPACISDLGALQSAYLALCSQSPPR